MLFCNFPIQSNLLSFPIDYNEKNSKNIEKFISLMLN